MGAESYLFATGNRTRLSADLETIPDDAASCNWRDSLRKAVRDTEELASLLDLPPGSLTDTAGATQSFPMLVPREFIARMRKGDPEDPLLRQVLPHSAETASNANFGPDPLAEQSLARHGCIQKYPGRVLLITTGACPVHCRYCFRREFPYSAQTAGRDDWQPALESIARSPGVSEVILSGGDPLSLGNERLGRLLREIEKLPKIHTLRIHTRFPIVLPSRIDAGLLRLLESTRLRTVVVVHANHPAEIDAAVIRATVTLRKSVNLLLNQSVLLRGINDNVTTLIELGEALVSAGIAPYYLHLLDRVSGAMHFDVAEQEACELIATMRRQAPGYLVPRLVRDRAGELSKTPFA
jgi:EF-P beta-lysylation protein EpmB